MTSILRDLRFALRLLAKNPGLTAVALLTMALGIAANTVIFTFVHASMLRPLPYVEADRLVQVSTQFSDMAVDRFWVSAPEMRDVAKDVKSFQDTGAWADGMVTLVGGDEPVPAIGAYCTTNLLPMLGVKPMLGRFFTDAEDLPMQPQAIVLGYDLWKRHFQGDPSIVGRTILADAMRVTVVGVMPEGFDFPGHGVEAWVPLGLHDEMAQRQVHFLYVLSRLAPGATIEGARAEIASLVEPWKQAVIADSASRPSGSSSPHVIDCASGMPEDRAPGAHRHRIIVNRLRDELTRFERPALLVLQGAVGFVLLIACANVSSLLLSLAESRTPEVAMRTALGATPGRLLRQFLTEAVVLGALGGALGLLLSQWGLDIAKSLAPDATRAHVQMDGTVLAFTAAVTVLTSLVFGLAPALQLRAESITGALGGAGAGARATASAARRRVRRTLVAAEVAMAVVLLAGAGLTLRSFLLIQGIDPGFDPAHLAMFDVEVPEKRYPGPPAVLDFWRIVGARLRTLPGVASVSVTTAAPLRQRMAARRVQIESRTPGAEPQSIIAEYTELVGPHFLSTMGIRILEGRDFAPEDSSNAMQLAIVNETFAHRAFPGESAVGKRLVVRNLKGGEDWKQTVIGVVADTKQRGPDAPTGAEIYYPLEAARIEGYSPLHVTFVMRTVGDAAGLRTAVQHEVAALDSSLPVSMFRTADDLLQRSVDRPRFLSALLVALATLALLMVGVGIYGITTHTVQQRTRELGIRLALGAPPRRLLGLILSQGLLLAGAGLGAGLLSAIVLSATLRRAFATVVFEGASLDAGAYALLAVLIGAVSAVASYVPALRATRIPPATAMRGS